VKHYYLVASLPTLVLGEPAPLGGEELLERAGNFLLPNELDELRRVVEGRVREGVSEFSRRWSAADAQLRNAAARVRAGKRGVEPKEWLREHEGFDTYMEKAVADAYAKPNPLERELSLDRHRWQTIDEMVLMDPFGFSAVLAWALKLGIAARWAGMSDEAGRKNVADVLETMGTV
jgi:hypothetical protein